MESVEKWDDLDILMYEIVSCRLTSVDTFVLRGRAPADLEIIQTREYLSFKISF